MLKNYIKVAWRNITKSKLFSLINVLGLSIGLTCCMLISLYILNETHYDAYHINAREIYQVGTTFIGYGKTDKLPNTPAALGETMEHAFPEIVRTARLASLFGEDKTLLQYNTGHGPLRSFYETRGYLADAAFFRMFTYHFIEGDPSSALHNPNSVVLSEEIAKKIFGEQRALHQVIHISSSTNGDHDFLVTGVFRPVGQPSHIDARFFMSMMGGTVEEMIRKQGANLATNNMFFTYLQLRPGTDPAALEAKFPAFMDHYAGNDLKAIGFSKKQFLVPLRKIHLDQDVKNNVTPGGSVTYLYILGSIALFTLLIACINFMNLATARSAKRSSEVGIRKVLGAEKKFLVAQFLGEAILMSLGAFVLALLLTEWFLPLFNAVSGKDLSLSLNGNGILLTGFAVLSLVTGLVAGSYPAFYLSSFKPARVLKGRFSNSLSAVMLRKILVVFQFVISVVLIIASLVIARQMAYLRAADLGFRQNQQLVIPLRSDQAKKIYPAFRDELLKKSFVQNVGASWYYPGIPNPSDNIFYGDGENMREGHDVKMNYIDTRYLPTLQIPVLAGRIFSDEYYTHDTAIQTIVINEKAAGVFGFVPASRAVNRKIHFDYNGRTYDFTIIGVVRDFHYQDLHVPIEPFGFQLGVPPAFNYMIAHVRDVDPAAVLQSIRESWHELDPSEPLDYSFLDRDFQKNYEAEDKLSAIVTDFTVIAILISCLGLFGLATFSAEQRIREIGVRKVLGASVSSIVTLLSADFLKLVGLSVVIASPVAWFIMYRWLQGFAYRTTVGWMVFAATAGAALVIALLTVSMQAIRAAVSNPVKSLRTE